MSSIVVITGHEAHELERHLSRSGVICIRNENWEHSDMMASVKLGLDYLSHMGSQSGKILFTPADIPLFTLNTVKLLLKSGKTLAAPSINGKSGHPLLLSKELVPSILSYDSTDGLRGALLHTGIQKEFITVEDKGVLFDAELPADCEDLLQQHRNQPLMPLISVSLERELPFFDSSSAMLLHLIDQVHSVRKACSLMQLSYSKGWNILNEMERQAGITVINRRAGGVDGGSTDLTKDGLLFLHHYEIFRKKVTEIAQREFVEIFTRKDNHNE